MAGRGSKGENAPREKKAIAEAFPITSRLPATNPPGHLAASMTENPAALLYLRAGDNLLALQKQMGHADLETTEIYLNLSHEDLKHDHEKASPVSGLFPRKKLLRGLS